VPLTTHTRSPELRQLMQTTCATELTVSSLTLHTSCKLIAPHVRKLLRLLRARVVTQYFGPSPLPFQMGSRYKFSITVLTVLYCTTLINLSNGQLKNSKMNTA